MLKTWLGNQNETKKWRAEFQCGKKTFADIIRGKKKKNIEEPGNKFKIIKHEIVIYLFIT